MKNQTLISYHLRFILWLDVNLSRFNDLQNVLSSNKFIFYTDRRQQIKIKWLVIYSKNF